jgi:hypothetical protein
MMAVVSDNYLISNLPGSHSHPRCNGASGMDFRKGPLCGLCVTQMKPHVAGGCVWRIAAQQLAEEQEQASCVSCAVYSSHWLAGYTAGAWGIRTRG